MDGGFGAAGGLLVFIWFVGTLGTMVGGVIFLVAAWRAMRAHEEIAATMTELVEALREGRPGARADTRSDPTTRMRP